MRLLPCLLFLSCPVPAAAQTYLADFLDALNRCQSSIETTTGFFDDGLERLDENSVAGQANAELSSNVRDHRIWRFPSSPLQVTYSTYDRGGQLHSTCEVSLVKSATPLTSEQRASLLQSFTHRMEQQIADGTHERRDVIRIPPIVNLGYGPLERGIHGCRVMISLAFDPESDFFSAGVGEQITHPCKD